MALKPDRVEHLTDISFYKNDAVAERGLVVAHSTGGSGAAMDDALAQVVDVAALTDEPAGVLLNDVVNIDLTRQHYNQHQDEMQLGGKVTLLRIGTIVTDQYSGTPVIGEAAHFDLLGRFVTSSQLSTSAQVGRFLSVPDADGFVKVAVNII